MIVTGIGIITGNWQNKFTKEEYLLHYRIMNSYGHPTGYNAMRQLNEQANKEIIREVREN